MKKLFVVFAVFAIAPAAFAAVSCNCTAGDADCYMNCIQQQSAALRKATAQKVNAAKTAANTTDTKAALKAKKAEAKQNAKNPKKSAKAELAAWKNLAK